MKTMIRLCCTLALLAMANGCASPHPTAGKKPDSILEQPTVANSGPEIHGYVSVGYGWRIK